MAVECITRIRKLGKAGIKGLWQQIKDKHTPGWAEGKAFEFLILRTFELEGAQVRWPYEVRLFEEILEQIDGAIHLTGHGLSFIVECKDQALKINIESIAKMRNQLLRRPSGAIGAVFSTSGFTRRALMLAQFLAPQTILLWNKKDIEAGIENSNLVEEMLLKYKTCIEEGANINAQI